MNDFLEKKLNTLKLKRLLPKNNALANYKPYVQSDNLIFISGQLPLTKEGIKYRGKIKKGLTQTKLNLLLNLQQSIYFGICVIL